MVVTFTKKVIQIGDALQFRLNRIDKIEDFFY